MQFGLFGVVLGMASPVGGAKRSARPRLDSKAFYDSVVDEVLVDDFVDISAVNPGVPNSLRIDHHAGTFAATV